jgi:hypothetical protein
MVIVLVPKGKGDYHSIGLLEPIWKVVEVLRTSNFLPLNSMTVSMVSGPVEAQGMEVKLAQQLPYQEQEAWHQIFLDLHKAYNAMDRGCCLDILVGYGMGPKLIQLLDHFWNEAKLACHAGGYYRSVFSAGQGLKHRAAHSHLASLTWLLMQLSESGSTRCLAGRLQGRDWGAWRRHEWLYSMQMMGCCQQDAQSGCRAPSMPLLICLNVSVFAQMHSRRQKS